MNDETDFTTSLSLLLQIQDVNEQDAWRTFIEKYRPLLLRWCADAGLRGAEIEETVAVIIARLVEQMPRFRFDADRGRFRGWLRIVVRNVLTDRLREQERQGPRGTGDSDHRQMLEQLAAPESIDTLVDDWQGNLEKQLHELCQRVQQRVEPTTWQAFWLTLVDGLSGPEAAARLNMPVAHVYVAKSRVLKLLKAEAAELDKPIESQDRRTP